MTSADKAQRLAAIDTQIAALQAQRAAIEAIVPVDETMNPYFLIAGQKKPLADIALPIDPATQRTNGVNIGLDSAVAVTVTLSRTGYTYGPMKRSPVNGVVTIADGEYKFSANTYTLTIDGQWWTFKVTATAPNPTPVPAPAPAPAPTPTPAPSAIAIKGVHASGDNIAKAIAAMQSIGAKAARFWGEGRKSGFSDPSYLAPVAKAGIKTCHLLTLDGKPSFADVLSYDDIKRMGPAQIKKEVAAGTSYLEGNNEIDNPDYMQQVGQAKIIAAMEAQMLAWREVIDAAGAPIKLIAPSTCVGLGMFTAIAHSKIPLYVDYLNMHIYVGDAASQESYIAQAVALAKSVGKPLVMTEWGLHRSLTKDKSDPTTEPVDPVSWAAEEAKAWNVLKNECAILFRFPLTVIHNTRAGPAALFNADYSRRSGNLDAFRTTYMAMK